MAPRGARTYVLRKARGGVHSMSELPPHVDPAHAEAAWPREKSRGSFIVDAHGTILAFDERMEHLTGWRAIDVVGRPKDLIGGPADAPVGRALGSRPLYEGGLPPSLPAGPLD